MYPGERKGIHTFISLLVHTCFSAMVTGTTHHDNQTAIANTGNNPILGHTIAGSCLPPLPPSPSPYYMSATAVPITHHPPNLIIAPLYYAHFLPNTC